LNPNNKANKYIHLTNVSINKYNLDAMDRDNTDVIFGGSKVSLKTLAKTFADDFKVDWDKVMWPQIR